MCSQAAKLGLKQLCAAAILCVAPFAILGCSGGGPGGDARGREVRVTERDFHIRAPRRPLRAGALTLAVQNKGPDSHEMIVIRAPSSRLPLRRDGTTVDEEGLEKRISGALEPEGPGTHRLRVRLAPGRYELICNMSGHYFGGMRTRLVVQ